jgi:hypothetical protein
MYIYSQKAILKTKKYKNEVLLLGIFISQNLEKELKKNLQIISMYDD